MVGYCREEFECCTEDGYFKHDFSFEELKAILATADFSEGQLSTDKGRPTKPLNQLSQRQCGATLARDRCEAHRRRQCAESESDPGKAESQRGPSIRRADGRSEIVVAKRASRSRSGRRSKTSEYRRVNSVSCAIDRRM